MPIRLWSETGTLVWQANADAWGHCEPETPDGSIHQPLRLPGQFEDELTGLHHNRFRDYDPETGRYLTPDPLGIKGGLNSYRYTNNPVDFIDPLGLSERESAAQNLADAQTSIGESVLNALGWVDEKTTVKPLAEMQTGAMQGLDNLGVQAVNSGNEWAIPLLGATYAMTAAVFPTSGLDFVPGGKAGKLGKLGKYSDEATDAGQTIKRNESPEINGRQYWNKSTDFEGHKIYQRDDLIDPNLVDARNRTNHQRMEKGLAPIGPDGKSMNLHHMTQSNDGALAEMTQTFHQNNSSTIHINPSSTPSGIDRAEFNKLRSNYWKSRANSF